MAEGKVIPSLQLDSQTWNMKATKVQTIPFSNLPPEIRNRIYHLVLIRENRTDIADICFSFPPGNPDERLNREELIVDVQHNVSQPPLTRTTSWIRAETLPISYGLNTFEIDLILHRNALTVAGCTVCRFPSLQWLAAIGPKNRMSIRHFYLRAVVDVGAGLEECEWWLRKYGIDATLDVAERERVSPMLLKVNFADVGDDEDDGMVFGRATA